ncbi:MAG: hypothetical protein AAF657_00250 [Acidobacteriota bacterium]
MFVCRRSGKVFGRPDAVMEGRGDEPDRPRFGLGEGGPVFVPRRKPSAIALALLADVASAESAASSSDLGR